MVKATNVAPSGKAFLIFVTSCQDCGYGLDCSYGPNAVCGNYVMR